MNICSCVIMKYLFASYFAYVSCFFPNTWGTHTFTYTVHFFFVSHLKGHTLYPIENQYLLIGRGGRPVIAKAGWRQRFTCVLLAWQTWQMGRGANQRLVRRNPKTIRWRNQRDLRKQQQKNNNNTGNSLHVWGSVFKKSILKVCAEATEAACGKKTQYGLRKSNNKEKRRLWKSLWWLWCDYGSGEKQSQPVPDKQLTTWESSNAGWLSS